ncbi:MAG: sugar phosphate isomerase [Cyclobacteriaceae bacterium]|nr:MAG: sugar phosphate isomerase [Cyclobacteriaceae bacterium]
MKTRRKFLKESSYLAAGSLILPVACTDKKQETAQTISEEVVESMPMNKSIGVQVYSVRDALKEDFSGSIKRLADIGFEYIEGYGLGTDGKILDMDPGEYRRMVTDTGLEIASTHCSYFQAEDSQKVLDAAAAAGIGQVIIAHLSEADRDYHKVAENLNKVGEIFKQAGVVFGYHNHAFEFENYQESTGLEVMLNETQSDLVKFQLDLYWAVKGGTDPVSFIEKYPGRFCSFHIKDAAEDLEQTTVGTGIVPFEGVFNIKGKSGATHFFVEDERTDNPFGNVEAAFNYLNQAAFV